MYQIRCNLRELVSGVARFSILICEHSTMQYSLEENRMNHVVCGVYTVQICQHGLIGCISRAWLIWLYLQ